MALPCEIGCALYRLIGCHSALKTLEERNRCIVIYFGPVDECHRQATRCFNPVDPELDPSSCGEARGAPSTGAGRERGCDGIGRALAFPSKKKNKLWIWLAFDRSGQRLIDWECGNRDAATLNRLLERLTTSSAGAQAQRSKTLERHAVLY